MRTILKVRKIQFNSQCKDFYKIIIKFFIPLRVINCLFSLSFFFTIRNTSLAVVICYKAANIFYGVVVVAVAVAIVIRLLSWQQCVSLIAL